MPSHPGHKASHPPALAPSHACALLPLQSGHKASCPGQSGCMALHPHTQGHKASRPPTLVPSCPCSQGTRPHAQGSQGARPHTQGMKPHTQGARPRALTPMQFELVFHFPPPLSAKKSKSLVKTKSVQVSPAPEHRTTTPCTFTERQKAFIVPHHLSKISGKNRQSSTKVTPTSHQ